MTSQISKLLDIETEHFIMLKNTIISSSNIDVLDYNRLNQFNLPNLILFTENLGQMDFLFIFVISINSC